jgi:hypothetical protein
MLHHFEYDPTISAYHGVLCKPFNFMSHPIAHAGSKVLTWDSPDNRGSWADHGAEGIYMGPALNHFRAFRVWVPANSAMRISATVWRMFPSFFPDNHLLTLQDTNISYPPTRNCPHPESNEADLLGRFFFESELGVCCITKLESIKEKKLSSRAQDRANIGSEKLIPLGIHCTLYYRCIRTNEEHYSSVDEILQWIRDISTMTVHQ